MQPSKETKSPALHSAVYMPSPGLIPSECSIKMKIPQQLTDYTKCFVFDRRSYNIRCIITHHFSFSLSFFGINLIIFLIIFVITRLLPIPQLLCLALAHQGKPFTMFHKMKKKKMPKSCSAPQKWKNADLKFIAQLHQIPNQCSTEEHSSRLQAVYMWLPQANFGTPLHYM